MSAQELLDAVQTDEAAWKAVDEAMAQVRDARLERQRLTRMLDAAVEREAEILSQVGAILNALKLRMEGKA